MNYRSILPLKNLFKNIHSFNFREKHFIFDGQALIIYEVKKAIFDTINCIKKHSIHAALKILRAEYTRNELDQAIAELLYIEKYNYANKINANIIAGQSRLIESFCTLSKIKSLTLFVCNDCNMECSYCARRKSNNRQFYMTSEIAERSIKFLMDHSDKNVTISFYGGEPLLNYGVVKEAVNYARFLNKRYLKNISFMISTNGTICSEEIMTFLVKNKFKIQISLDGPKMLHDRHRFFRNGKGSHSIVLRNIKKYYSRYLPEMMRIACVIPPGNFKKFNEIYTYLAKIEAKYRMPVDKFYPVEWRHEKYFLPSRGNIDGFKNIIEKTVVQTLKRCKKYNSYRPHFNLMITPLIKMLTNLTPKYSCCGAGINGFDVLPNGDLISCLILHNSRKKQTFGNILNLEKINDNKRLLAYRSTKRRPEECNNCWMRNICGANCPAYNYFYNNSFRAVYKNRCEIFKKMLESAVWLISKLKQYGIKDIKV